MTVIKIELLTTETLVYLPTIEWAGMSSPFNGCAVVDAIKFDGWGYALTLGDERHYVEAGETVQFGGVGSPILRSQADVTVDEWDAKFEADMAACDTMVSQINAMCADMQERRKADAEDPNGEHAAADAWRDMRGEG